MLFFSDSSLIFFFFFFSSRRRHTRSLCDWSSDVCSSDLLGAATLLIEDLLRELLQRRARFLDGAAVGIHSGQFLDEADVAVKIGRGRVGKECRSRWSPYH